MEISKYVAGAIVAMIAAGGMLTDGAHARDLHTGPMFGPSPALLNAVAAATATTTTATTAAQSAATKAAVALPPGAGGSPPKPAGPVVGEVREHGLGGNDDPCLAAHACDPGSALKSEIAKYTNNPPRAYYCESGFPAGQCVQGVTYYDATGASKVVYISFAYLHGPPLPGQMDKFIKTLQQEEAKYKGPTRKPLDPVALVTATPIATTVPVDPARDHRHQ
jgi:hypothetical protein